MARRPIQRISQVFNLGRTQATLDFVDVDIRTDTAVFVSPRALALLPSEWGDGCVYLVQNFFQTVLDLIKSGEHLQAENLLGVLREPNETHLGLSRGKSRGRALGEGSAHLVWSALSRSEAVKSGLLRDLEDTVLMIPGIGVDIVSDMTTNIIRGPLIEYTQTMARQVGIPLTEAVDSGPLWDPATKRWFSRYERLPMTTEGKLLLVPKAIVRADLQYRTDKYYRHYLLNHLRRVELNANSSLVYMLKDGTRKVDKTALIEKYGSGKKTIVEQTLKHPEVLEEYRAEMDKEDYSPLSHEQIAFLENVAEPDWDALLASVLSIPVGAESATAYERATEGLLTALFYPDLTNPNLQYPLHGGRKRVDIKYTNMGREGFFRWLATHYPVPLVWIECKNYSNDVANQELDQLAGRFSPSRGQFGLMLSRSFANKDLFFQRCKDTARDGRGFIIPVDDSDLSALVGARKQGGLFQEWGILRRAFEALIS